ncbi:MAG: hypothetical protein ACI9U2_003385 [Bradymonadia bacterium]
MAKGLDRRDGLSHNQPMGRIIVTIAGPWTEPPDLDSSLDLAFGPGERVLADDMIQLGRGLFDPPELAALRGHTGIVQGVIEFEQVGDTEPAIAAAKLLLDAFEKGATGVLIETADRVLVRGSLKGLSPRDTVVLFNIFVGVFVTPAQVESVGMCAFDLPDVEAPLSSGGNGDETAAVTALAGQMVCDGMRPTDGMRFQPTLSAPHYVVSHRDAAPATEDDPPWANPRGAWVLTRIDD